MLVIWPLTLMKRAHLSELFISRFSTYIRKAMTVIAQDQWNTKIHYWYFEVFNVHKSLGSLWWRWVPNRHLIIRWRGVRFQTIQISVLVIALLQFAEVGWKICNVRKKMCRAIDLLIKSFALPCPCCCRRCGFLRFLRQTTTATATKTWKNKRSNWQNNSSTRAF